MTAPGESTSRRRGALTVALVVATVVLVAVVAGGGRVPIATEGTGGWHLDPPVGTAVPSGPPAEDEASTAAPPGQSTEEALKETIALVLGAIALAFIARTLLRSRRPVAGRLDLSRDTAPPAPVVELVDDAVEQGLAALASGPTDDVIVACWVRLEDAAAAAGVERDPAETPAELAARVLAELGVPRGPVDTLLGLYRTARYSRHPLEEADRAAAVAALGSIRSNLGATA